MFRVHFGLPLVIPDENNNKTNLFSFGIARGSPKCTLNVSPPIEFLGYFQNTLAALATLATLADWKCLNK